MSDTDFEFNMDFALMDQQIEKFKVENAKILNEQHKGCELLHAQIEELKLRREETIMQCELLKQDLAKAAEVLKYFEEQSRHKVLIVVGAPLREAICVSLNGICEKIA